MKFEFIHQHGDMIVVLPPKNKADQAGERTEGKHIAANIYNPEICPVLAFAQYVFCLGSQKKYSSVFTRAAYGGFGKAFHDVVHSDEAQQNMGVNPYKLGKHSCRKGGATWVSSFPGGPDRDAICQRADWTLSGVRQRYITSSNNGNDQFCARVLVGLG
jgi:hypothetical protein